MKFHIVLLGFFLLGWTLAVSAWAAPPAGYSLIWSDEFNGNLYTAPNPDVWKFQTGKSGNGNNELETYTDERANSSIFRDLTATDGKALAIRANEIADGYSSARIDTNGLKSFQYGYIESRIRMPYGQGIWPAFWMLGDNVHDVGWPKCGEIDIMENIGKATEQGKVHGSLHGPGYSGAKCLGAAYTLPNNALFKDAYHTFAILWQPDEIQFFVDDVLYETRTPKDCGSNPWVFNHPFFLILNLAIGGYWPGSPDSTTTFPQTMYVDYVRVYQQAAPMAAPAH